MMNARIALVLAIAGCSAGVPASPTYFTDVAPILRANCVRCHGADPIEAKIATFRLDRYVAMDTATFDVYDYATGMNPDMIRVAVAHESPAMPPDYALTDRQQQILTNWAANGAPKGTRGNQLPRIALVSPQGAATADQTLDVTFRSWDDDFDGLIVQLWAHDTAATGTDTDVPLGKPTGGGQRALSIDAGTLASKHTFEIYAILDDGYHDDPTMNRTHATLIPSLYVDHGARGTAPTVVLVTPNGGDTLIGSANITWTATDPDVGDSVTIALDLIKVAPDGTETVALSIATGLANTGSYTWMIPGSVPAKDASGAAIPYRIRVTGTDMLGVPPNVRSDESDGTVTIAQAMTTTLTWPDVKPTFVTYCKACHGDPAKTAALDYFCLLQYKLGEVPPPTCAATDEGVYEVSSKVYQKLVVDKSMPPAGNPMPTQMDRDNVGAWIQGGAPYGSGSGSSSDLPPTFAWTAPSSTQTGNPVTLNWNATDVEGISSGKLEYAKVNGIPSSGCTPTNTMSATWTAISGVTGPTAGATSWAGPFSWTVPTTTTGYYCVRGSVTDTANQTTTVLDTYGIK